MFEQTRQDIWRELKPVRDAAEARGNRSSYADTLAKYHRGLFTCGFMWALADHDEVFTAFLIKNGVEKP